MYDICEKSGKSGKTGSKYKLDSETYQHENPYENNFTFRADHVAADVPLRGGFQDREDDLQILRVARGAPGRRSKWRRGTCVCGNSGRVEAPL